MTDIVTLENTNEVIGEIQNAFYDIPFENSTFQTEAFVLAGQITPERAYRIIGLQMMTKLRALNSAKIGKLKEQVALDEIEYNLNSGTLNEFDRRREEIKKQEIYQDRYWNDKLINDAITELNVLYKHFKALPKYTREQFESGERLHYEQSLNRQLLGLDGAKGSLIHMTDDIRALTNYQEKFMALEDKNSENILGLALSMENLLKEKPGIG